MENAGGELSGKYCSKLGTNVMVIKTKTESGETRRLCLSSHLCHSDVKKACDMAKNQNEIKNNQNTL